jgi:alginate O-acetyltransferase complex protein AlgI
MTFISLDFFIFFLAIFLLYWIVGKNDFKKQNIILLIAGYAFYASANWQFVFYLVGVSFLNFYLGIYIERNSKPIIKNILFYIGIIQGIGGLFFYKYYNFFIFSFKDIFHDFNIINIIAPLGISFYTFRSLSYIIDVNNEKIKPSKNILSFFNYIAFFPCIISGPIDRLNNFLPQIEKKRVFNYNNAIDALTQILWGAFKKIVIADNCSIITSAIFTNYHSNSGSNLILGAFLYTIQLYCDFSGYSDIAIGLSKLLGLNIPKNFDNPLFSKSIPEYWRKWHMSLTSWLTEYVYTPLSIKFRNFGKFGLIISIITNFILCGLWHGAKNTYIFFGFINGLYFIPGIIRNKKFMLPNLKYLEKIIIIFKIFRTFTLITFTLIIFRSDNITEAFQIIEKIFSISFFTLPDFHLTIYIFIIFLFIIEYYNRFNDFGLQFRNTKFTRTYKVILYTFLIFTIILYYPETQSPFIYLKF